MTGRIYLIPVTLGGEDYLKVIPEKVIKLTRLLRFFIVEDIRSARRFLRLIDKEFPIDDSVFFELMNTQVIQISVITLIRPRRDTT